MLIITLKPKYNKLNIRHMQTDAGPKPSKPIVNQEAPIGPAIDPNNNNNTLYVPEIMPIVDTNGNVVGETPVNNNNPIYYNYHTNWQPEITEEPARFRATDRVDEQGAIYEPTVIRVRDSNNRIIAERPYVADVPARENSIPRDTVADTREALYNMVPTDEKRRIGERTNASLERLRTGWTTDGNTTMDDYKSSPDSLSLMPGPVTIEAKLTDVALKSMIASADTILQASGKQVTRSKELTEIWKAHITKLDTYISKLSSWKRTLGYGACLVTVGLFIWKIGAMRAIPDFLTNMIGIVPSLAQEAGCKTAKETSKEGFNHTFDTIMETPLTPIAIVTGVGLLTVGIAMLKIVAWALRRAPK
jgi:hypothetical protein